LLWNRSTSIDGPRLDCDSTP